MQDTHPTTPGFHWPTVEPVPLVVWLVEPRAGVVDRLRNLGAFVAMRDRSESGAWPQAVAQAVDECRRRFARAYVIRRASGVARVAAGLPGTPAHDADPWSVALLVGAVRDAGLAATSDPARPGGGASDDLQGFELALPADADDVLVAAVGALTDGLRIAQLKC